MLRNSIPPSAPPAPLAAILADLIEAGIRPTPLAVLCRATDRGLSDDEVSQIVDALAADRELEMAA